MLSHLSLLLVFVCLVNSIEDTFFHATEMSCLYCAYIISRFTLIMKSFIHFHLNSVKERSIVL